MGKPTLALFLIVHWILCLGDFLEADKELKEAIEECAKVLEKRGKRPYMIVISRANLHYASPEDKKKGRMSGTASYMYTAKPKIAKNGLSKLLIDTSKLAIQLAEKELGESGQ